MAESAETEFFTKKHARLTDIALYANIFAWVVLIVHIIIIGVRFIEFQHSQFFQSAYLNLSQYQDLIDMLTINPVYTLGFIANTAWIFMRGIVYWLVLKGIALGLRMIVETDLNYRGKLELANHE
jgi:hypothetical protein